eukprot:TRINITY_DN3428_c0_g1_i3.p1 TRINITY_DN3428_c0_g1~~TRINITY_DN3428_c0_g1_i3.p1  ORF type:complete len:838 (+),score=88.78 TRINITY_DN3428_c0_g1_i3:55-2514(+)
MAGDSFVQFSTFRVESSSVRGPPVASGLADGGSTCGTSFASLVVPEDVVARQHFGLAHIGADAASGSWRPTREMIRKLEQLRPEREGASNAYRSCSLVWLVLTLFQKIDWSDGLLIGTYLLTFVAKSARPTNIPMYPSVSGTVGAGMLRAFASLAFSSTLSATIRPSGTPFFSCHAFVRIVCIQIVFTASAFLGQASAAEETSDLFRYELGNVYGYTPMAAMCSLLFLGRVYGRLEVLSFLIMSLAFAVLGVLLLEVGDDTWRAGTFLGMTETLLSATLSAFASTLMERIYKGRSRRVKETFGGAANFHIYRFHLDVAACLMYSTCAAALLVSPSSSSEDLNVFEWPWESICWELAVSAQSWLTGMMVMRFSTVSTALGTTMMSLSVMQLTPAKGNLFVNGLLSVIIAASALIFKKGRCLVANLRQLVHDDRAGGIGSVILSLSDMNWRSFRDLGVTYGSLIIFVTSDATRSITQQLAVGKSEIVPQSMVLMSYVAGVIVATVLTVSSAKSSEERWEALRLAYSPRKIMRYLPSSFLFALSAALGCLAYGFGISASLYTALGYVYMPISAILSRIFFGKYYTDLEWLGLLVLTCAAGTFGFMESSSSDSEEERSSFVAMACVVVSATVSVVASLLMEKCLKEECLPFHIQKVRLDIGGVLSSLILLLVIGVISDRVQDGFWHKRPLNRDCDSSKCWLKSKGWVFGELCSDPACTCECGSGLFVAWGPVTVAALSVYVMQGWLVGLVVKQFSTVLRSIAQASTILVIYFVAAPLFNTGDVQTPSLTLVALIVPLSTTIFMVSVSELRKVADVATVIWMPE